MIRNRIQKNPQTKKSKILFYPNKDFHFFPLYPSLGFVNRGNKTVISEKVYNSIINGETTTILKWLGSENALEWNDPNNNKSKADQPNFTDKFFKRQIQIGQYFYGFITDASFNSGFTNKQTGYQSVDGKVVSFTEQIISKRISIIMDEAYEGNKFSFLDEGTDIIDSNKVRLFFLCPELTGNDVLIIDSLEPKYDAEQKVFFTIVNFVSLNEQLNGIGKQIDTLVSFGAPGESPVLPFVDTLYEKKVNDEWVDFESLYNIKIESDIFRNVENTKKVYISNVFNQKEINVKYVQIDYNGLAGINSIFMMGRVRQQTGDLVGVMKPLFLTNITTPIRPLIAQHKPMITFNSCPATVENLSWYKNKSGLSEFLRSFFDPNKQRESVGVLLFESDVLNIGVSGKKLSLYYDKKDKYRIGGQDKLIFSRYSDYIIKPIKSSDGTLTSSSKDINNEKDSGIDDILATCSIYELTNPILTPGGKIIINTRDWVNWLIDVSSAGVSLISSVIGLGVGGGGGAIKGFFGAQMLTFFIKRIVSFIPTSVFETTDKYWQGSKSNFLIPNEFLRNVGLKLAGGGTSKLTITSDVINSTMLPLALFNNVEGNYYSGLINTQIFPVSIFGEITDRINGKDTSSFLEANSNFSLKKDKIIQPQKSNNNFIIDYMSNKALTLKSIRVSFFNDKKELVWESTQKSQGQQTGNIYDWNTEYILSSYQDDFKTADERYLAPSYNERYPETINNLKELKDLKREYWLNNCYLTTVNTLSTPITRDVVTQNPTYNYSSNNWNMNDKIVKILKPQQLDYIIKSPNSCHLSISNDMLLFVNERFAENITDKKVALNKLFTFADEIIISFNISLSLKINIVVRHKKSLIKSVRVGGRNKTIRYENWEQQKINNSVNLVEIVSIKLIKKGNNWSGISKRFFISNDWDVHNHYVKSGFYSLAPFYIEINFSVSSGLTINLKNDVVFLTKWRFWEIKASDPTWNYLELTDGVDKKDLLVGFETKDNQIIFENIKLDVK